MPLILLIGRVLATDASGSGILTQPVRDLSAATGYFVLVRTSRNSLLYVVEFPIQIAQKLKRKVLISEKY